LKLRVSSSELLPYRNAEMNLCRPSFGGFVLHRVYVEKNALRATFAKALHPKSGPNPLAAVEHEILSGAKAGVDSA
jgi:hypothetical protein